MTVKFCDACGGVINTIQPQASVAINGGNKKDLCPNCESKLGNVLEKQEWGKQIVLPATV